MPAGPNVANAAKNCVNDVTKNPTKSTPPVI